MNTLDPELLSLTEAIVILRRAHPDSTTGVSWGTAIAVRLAGGTSTTVTLTHYLPSGQTVIQTASLSSTSPMAILDQRFNANLPDGNVMGGVLTTNPASTIVATVNVQAQSTSLGDSYMSYEGIAQ